MLDRIHTVWCSAAAGTGARPVPLSSPPDPPPPAQLGGTSGGGGSGRVVIVSAADDGWIRLADIAIMLVVVLDRSGKAAAVMDRSRERQWLARRFDSITSFLYYYRDRVMYAPSLLL
jgi:hypothetical protein